MDLFSEKYYRFKRKVLSFYRKSTIVFYEKLGPFYWKDNAAFNKGTIPTNKRHYSL